MTVAVLILASMGASFWASISKVRANTRSPYFQLLSHHTEPSMTVRNDHCAQKLDTGLVSVDVEVTGGYGGSGDRRQETNAAVVQCQPTPKFRHLLLLAILALPGCSGQAQAPGTVFCAASLAPVVQALAQAYQKNGGLGGTGQLRATSTLASRFFRVHPLTCSGRTPAMDRTAV